MIYLLFFCAIFCMAIIFMRILAFIGGCILALIFVVWVLEQISNFSS